MGHSVITTLVFDFGGVLIEWNPRFLYRRYFNSPQEMEAFLSEINFSEWNSHQDRGRPFAEGVRELSARFPQHASLIEAYHENWVDSVGESIPGTIEIVRRARQHGYQVFGLSNWSAETFPLVRQRSSFLDLLDGYMLSGEVKLAKPDPSIFHLFLARIGRQAHECLFIDDSPANITVAERLGFHCILFQSPAQLEHEMAKLGVFEARP